MKYGEVLAYIDDLLIPSTGESDGLELLELVLDLIEQAGVKLKLEKCSFLQNQVEYLGHEISGEGIRPGSRKVQAVLEFPQPKDVHGVRQFVGLASYFRKFIYNFSVLARPLTDLTKKDVPWCWEQEQRRAFTALQENLANRPLLAIYDGQADTELHTDASKLGISGILIQKGVDGRCRPVEYYSRATTVQEQVYHSYELETLAVVESVKRFRVYLIAVHFKVVTDCVAVRAALLKRDLVPRIARWWLAIQEYDMEIEYRPGKRMQHADALSRNPIGVGVNVVAMDDGDWFLTVQLQDPKAQELVRLLRTGDPSKEVKVAYKIKQERLYRITPNGDRLYVPAMARFNLLRKHHDDIGHPASERCFALLAAAYWFPKMRRFVSKYVKSCLRCAFAKGQYGRGEGFLHPIERRPIPFDTVHVDHLGPFVRSARGNSYLLMVVDGFTKFVLAKPCKTLKSSEAIRLLGEVFGEFGYPRRLISDQGKAFKCKEFNAFMAEKGIKHIMNAVATPRANGQVERPNRTIVEALSSTAETEGRWDDGLPQVVWALNNTINATTRYCPADLMFSHSRGIVADLASGELASDTEPGEGYKNPEDGSQVTATDPVYTEKAAVPGVSGGDPQVVAGEEVAGETSASPGEAKARPMAVSRTDSDLERQGDDSANAPTQAGESRRQEVAPRRSERLRRRNDTTEPVEKCGGLQATGYDGVQRNRATALKNIIRAGERMKRRFDRRRKVATSYKVGDLVLWRSSAAPKAGVGLSHKLVNKFDGPYRISKVLANDRYQLESIKGVRGYKRFRAIVAADAIRRYHSVNDVECESQGDDDEAGD